MQDKYWHADEHHRLNWAYAADEIGKQTMAAFRDMNSLRASSPALGRGWLKVLTLLDGHLRGVATRQLTRPWAL